LIGPAAAAVPVAAVSRLARRAISGALSISENVIAVAVVTCVSVAVAFAVTPLSVVAGV
jgi:hypothetical protein